MIEIKNINQRYNKNGRKKTLEDISLVVKENAITALIGANGAGKSTLLGVITNLIPALSGTVTIDGMDIKRIKTSEVAKKVAILKQTHNINIRITVNDLVEFGRFPHCGGRLTDVDKQKAEESLKYMNLSGLEHRYLDELSGGQRQRAFIAMILAQDTPYIFFDEPLNNLDIKYSVEMMKVIKNLVIELNKTVVVVLHDINFASAYADHIIAMKDGRIISQGSPKDIITKAVLDDVFDHDFNIVEQDGKSVCLYYDKM
ncbi:iron(3+)-hydroxamate import ATP-binding protein FhuC [Oxobacter pfennigii]|uniref:Iron(3+)-hydroxamate import ATP-binding protein FhuC n=1 Tax=Oxobacter pfennigii TaxID=36849 RepID=A0A0P8WRH6_9CLOT|nr:ATP-binding cassette domain-containing protein [Oxobacter pfennigii]KPU45201.1 iron(3+)-hydroxamate import ATP-binding protein FhuC [Oxobacter pfennigii]